MLFSLFDQRCEVFDQRCEVHFPSASTGEMNGSDKTIKTPPYGETRGTDDRIHLRLQAVCLLSENIYSTVGEQTAQVFKV